MKFPIITKLNPKEKINQKISIMSTEVKTPIKTSKTINENVMSTPLFVPPTPLLSQLGYGTGKIII